jgi:hypothetical protein
MRVRRRGGRAGRGAGVGSFMRRSGRRGGKRRDNRRGRSNRCGDKRVRHNRWRGGNRGRRRGDDERRMSGGSGHDGRGGFRGCRREGNDGRGEHGLWCSRVRRSDFGAGLRRRGRSMRRRGNGGSLVARGGTPGRNVILAGRLAAGCRTLARRRSTARIASPVIVVSGWETATVVGEAAGAVAAPGDAAGESAVGVIRGVIGVDGVIVVGEDGDVGSFVRIGIGNDVHRGGIGIRLGDDLVNGRWSGIHGDGLRRLRNGGGVGSRLRRVDLHGLRRRGLDVDRGGGDLVDAVGRGGGRGAFTAGEPCERAAGGRQRKNPDEPFHETILIFSRTVGALVLVLRSVMRVDTRAGPGLGKSGGVRC